MVLADLEAANNPSKCLQGEAVPAQLVVAARYSEDVSWLTDLEPHIPYLVYQAEIPGNQEAPYHHSNTAREASAFLAFIAEHYDCLPNVTAFVHGHRHSWHSNDMGKTLRILNWDQIRGYVPLSNGVYSPWGAWVMSYPSAPERHLRTVLASGGEAQNGSFPADQIINNTVYLREEEFQFRQASNVALAWEEFLGPAGLGDVPGEIQYFCCGQFAVTRERIMLLPRNFYLQAIYWIENSTLGGSISPVYSKSLVFETVWHLLFGEAPRMAHPDPEDECQTYRCL